MRLRLTEKANRLIGSGRFVIPVFADLHTDSLDDRHLNAQLEVLREFCSIRRPDAVISLGDMPAMLGREKHASDEQISELLSGICSKLSEAAGCPLLAINGNHDGIGTDFFSPRLWNGAVGNRFDRGLAKHDRDSVYFTADFGDHRFIFLSIPHGSELDSEYPAPLWSFGEDQLDWLEKTLANSIDKKVVIFSHVPLCSVYNGDPSVLMDVWDGKTTRKATRASLCGWIDDRDRAEQILNRFDNIICAVAGHEHFDAVYEPGEKRNDFDNRLRFPQLIVSSHRIYKDSPEAFFTRGEFDVISLSADATPALKVIIF